MAVPAVSRLVVFYTSTPLEQPSHSPHTGETPVPLSCSAMLTALGKTPALRKSNQKSTFRGTLVSVFRVVGVRHDESPKKKPPRSPSPRKPRRWSLGFPRDTCPKKRFKFVSFFPSLIAQPCRPRLFSSVIDRRYRHFRSQIFGLLLSVSATSRYRRRSGAVRRWPRFRARERGAPAMDCSSPR